MPRNLIKYRLTVEGEIPDFLYLGDDGVNGVFGVVDPNTPWPRNLVQIGITNDGAIGDFEVIPTKAELLLYLTTVGANWETPDSHDFGNITKSNPFDPSFATDWVWNCFLALEGI